ncbi:MAG TPA: dienelactone hydrolase family protein [Gemmatimonadaceae bacterium]
MQTQEMAVAVPLDGVELHGDLNIPQDARGIILFAHGSGSSRKSPRNRAVAMELPQAHFATLLLDLLSIDEERIDMRTAQLRFDIPLLATRLEAATAWLAHEHSTRHLTLGYFGASTGAAGALVAAARLPDRVHAVVSRGGRPDLAGAALPSVRAPTLLIVGGNDTDVIRLNQIAMNAMTCVKQMEIVPGAGHLFEEPGALDEVSSLAAAWFERHLAPGFKRAGQDKIGW